MNEAFKTIKCIHHTIILSETDKETHTHLLSSLFSFFPFLLLNNSNNWCLPFRSGKLLVMKCLPETYQNT